MAEFILDRFKYNWKGPWVGGTNYNRDDIIRYGGKSYVCLISHTADSNFYTDLNAILPGSSPPQPQPRWVLMTDGKSWIGSWIASQFYKVGDIVLINGSLWECNTAHTSSSFEANQSDWTLFADGIDFDNTWQTSKQYGRGAVVKYGGIMYKCITAHTSGSLLEDNASAWTEYWVSYKFGGVWSQGLRVTKNTFYRFGGSVWLCTESHYTDTIFDTDKFELQLTGFQYDGDWRAGVTYQEGDIVRFGGNLYQATANNISQQPDNAGDSTIPLWTLILRTYNFRGNWSRDFTYLPGDIVRRGGNLYVAIDFIPGSNDIDSTDRDLDYLDTSIWELLVPSKNWTFKWEVGSRYKINDVVFFLGGAYVCNIAHTASLENFPTDPDLGFTYWELLSQSATPAGLENVGDLLTYNTSIKYGDGSSLEYTALPIGTVDHLLSVNQAEDTVVWRKYSDDELVIWVSPNGEDREGYGLEPFLPVRSVQFAAQIAEDRASYDVPCKIRVSTGRYFEECPIIVSKNTVIMGDELRSTTIQANSAKVDYVEGDYLFFTDGLSRLLQIMTNVVTNTPVTPTVGNTEAQIFNETFIGDSTATTYLTTLNTQIVNYLNFNLGSGSTVVNVSGTNTQTTSPARIFSSQLIRLNRAFLAEELVAHIRNKFPTYDNIDEVWLRRFAKDFIRGWINDLLYDGNYYTYQSARRFKNSILGSGRDDMFYVRDITGLRNMTLEGLEGGLNPPGVFDLYQRPTGGAFVSLDPGWGPNDDRTWIMTRSPYIQGITTIGNNCIGQKVDGSIHNGGNRSITSNDFTQVLSDGIGAWVTNNARAELVSVFTYYCAIGYLAENGGVIRATNGNNSYGKYGSIADGVDADEVPITARVNNTVNEAQVNNAFAGEFTDEIFALEYSNCGQNYTSATGTIVGSGANARIEYDDFRDGGIFEFRLINPLDSGSKGGAGFLLEQTNAQSGTATQITLASNDEGTAAEYVGMRIVLTSGDGTGQYGEISSFNEVTKVAGIIKESDGQAGWDHIVPGTPIQSSLTVNTVYRIEPKVTVDPPGFSYSNWDISASYDIQNVAWGTTFRLYDNLTGALGSGETDGVSPGSAIWRVRADSYEYRVSLLNGGAGYAIGDTVTITGNNLGGATPANDVVITVTEVSEDSTNGVVNFTFTGTPKTGVWVVTTNSGTILYSLDHGEGWSAGSLPTSDPYSLIAGGEGKFVALRPNSSTAAFSTDGINWETTILPTTAAWSDIIYANGLFVVCAENDNSVLTSATGTTWNERTIPDDVVGDSTATQWQKVAYGQGKYIILGSERNIATSTDGVTWTRTANALPAGDYNWSGFAYGKNIFVAVTNNSADYIYSVNGGSTWYTATAPIPEGGSPNPFPFRDLKYGQGVFVAIGSPDELTSTFIATSEDGILWTERTIDDYEWNCVGFGNQDNEGRFLVIADDNSNSRTRVNKLTAGCTAKVRANTFGGVFDLVKIWDPGSGYDPENPPEITVFDTTFTREVFIDPRIANGVLAQPSFVNRGIGYRTTTTQVTVTGNGFADIIPEGNFVTISGLSRYPGPGAQISISGIINPDTDAIQRFVLVSNEPLGQITEDGTFSARFRVSPAIRNEDNLSTGTSLSIRERYAQCRITGHDFLDIGTGNFEQTNYPDLYAGGAFFTAIPENEVYEEDGGRVFYASTDQDGNFRAGELFSVQQATGIVTISADFFDLDGLSELALGGVRLGGSGTVVNEFSTDQTFSADSNNIVPTQRAIAAFLATRLSEGGSELLTNSLTAGLVRIGSDLNVIEGVGGVTINFPKRMRFEGVSDDGAQTSIRGTIVAQTMFLAALDQYEGVR